MYWPGICIKLAAVNPSAIVASTRHRDNVAIFVFWSHVSNDSIYQTQKGQTTFDLRELRPLSPRVGRACIRRTLAESSLAGGELEKATFTSAQNLLFFFHQRCPLVCLSRNS